MEYTVKQGDYLSKIAIEHGFADWKTIWRAPENAALRDKRVNPNVLYPGDKIHIPDRAPKEESAATEQHHQFVAKTRPLKLRLALKDLAFKGLGGLECDLQVDGEQFRLTSNGSGLVEQTIRPTAQRARLQIAEPPPLVPTQLSLDVGYLDPLDTVTGQKARLNNLGYFAGPLDREDEGLFRSAVEEFQCDHAMTVDGQCGPKTQQKLKQVHGC